jgi:hypothetical protein
MKVAVVQPSYLPWRGYFHLIQKSDVFVFYDCVQYDTGGWRNRNRIKTPDGIRWLTVPVHTTGHLVARTPIKDVPIVRNSDWSARHSKVLNCNYGSAEFFGDYQSLLDEIYSRNDARLCDLTCAATELIARALGIEHTRFVRSSTLPAKGVKTDRLISVLEAIGAVHYISGPSAKSYLEMDKFNEVGISVEFMDYNYRPYPQLHGRFEPMVTILDLLLNTGPEAAKFIWDAGER